MYSSNVPCKEKLAEVAERDALIRRLMPVIRAARILATGAESLGHKLFRESNAGDLMFLREALERADPWIRKEMAK